MTAITGSRGSGSFIMILLAAALLISLLLFAWGGIIEGVHAEKHGADAAAVRRCMDSNGPEMIFKHKHDSIFYLLCHLNDGRWGLQVVAKNGHEKTSFVPGDGSLRSVLDYLGKFATKFTGKMPWK